MHLANELMNIAPGNGYAVFLDRDGTLIEDVGYLHKPEDVVWKDGTYAALKRLQDAGYALVVITNQSGVGRGLFTEHDVVRVHERMRADLEREGIGMTGFYYCPHTPWADCDCRKPKPGMVLKAAEQWHIVLSGSWFIGDTCSDVEAGLAAGVRTCLVSSERDCPAVICARARSLNDAVDQILVGP